jgi:hypothetical protein
MKQVNEPLKSQETVRITAQSGNRSTKVNESRVRKQFDESQQSQETGQRRSTNHLRVRKQINESEQNQDTR